MEKQLRRWCDKSFSSFLSFEFELTVAQHLDTMVPFVNSGVGASLIGDIERLDGYQSLQIYM